MRECVEEGILQSYLDGELSPAMMETVAAHIASCGLCAAAAREAESETLMLSAAFAPELSLAVPTERLRERLDAAIAEMCAETPAVNSESRWRSWLGSLAALFAFNPQQAVGFASIVAAVTFALVFGVAVWRNSLPGDDQKRPESVVANNGEKGQTPQTERSEPQPSTNPSDLTPLVAKNVDVENSGVGRETSKRSVSTSSLKGKRSGPVIVKAERDLLLPGERGYLTAIATLSTAIKASGETALQPTLRAEYERNLAVVDQAISATRIAARRNPNDVEAAQFLYASYQSKIDLLSTVEQQARVSDTGR
ncbi:MAG TPA: zf-HC2 domain-containing protein [Pyrinomonadaceae bacterium]|nr:zf-HC2 domain-containing protein [Pyrinomonadaceae bacterium]